MHTIILSIGVLVNHHSRLCMEIVLELHKKLRKLNKAKIRSAEVEEFAEHLKNIHEEVRKHILKMNA